MGGIETGNKLQCFVLTILPNKPIIMSEIIENLKHVKQRIQQAVGSGDSVDLLAVSKKHAAEKIRLVAHAGQQHFGENYAQEAIDKMAELADLDLVWHFIGPIQSNKTKLIAGHFDWVQSVDRMKILKRLELQRPEEMAPLNVLLQIKIGDEDSKQGSSLDEIEAMAQWLSHAEKLTLRGLMCIPPPSDDEGIQRAYFNETKSVFDHLRKIYPDIDTLSMGMSNDLEAAIAAGASMVRIGTDIFGQRD